MNNVMARSAPLEPRFMGHVLDYLDLSDRVQDALAVANHAGYWFQKVAVGSAYCQKAADVSELCGKGLTIIDLCALPRSLVESCSSTASSVNEVSKRALFLANDLTGTLNGAMLAGHVIVEDCAIIGGMTPVHQFSKIGKHAMVGGLSRVSHDIPPYTIGAGSPYKLGGLNLIGLKRHNFSLDERRALAQAFKLTYRSGLRLSEALLRIEDEVLMTSHVQHWIEFCRTSKRGLIGLQGVVQSLQEEDEEIKELEGLLEVKV